MATIVYVLTNPAMPGIVKIGATTRDDPEIRMNELYTTGVPLPFDCAVAIELDESEGLEKALHSAFGPYRLNPSREFFEIDPYQAEAILRVWPGKDVTPDVSKETDGVDPIDIEAAKRFKRRRPNLNFLEMGIPVGSTLVSVDTDQEVTVVEERKVEFQGEEMYLSNATKLASGKDYVLAPTPRWTFEGRNLQDIYNETYVGRGE